MPSDPLQGAGAPLPERSQVVKGAQDMPDDRLCGSVPVAERDGCAWDALSWAGFLAGHWVAQPPRCAGHCAFGAANAGALSKGSWGRSSSPDSSPGSGGLGSRASGGYMGETLARDSVLGCRGNSFG